MALLAALPLCKSVSFGTQTLGKILLLRARQNDALLFKSPYFVRMLDAIVRLFFCATLKWFPLNERFRENNRSATKNTIKEFTTHIWCCNIKITASFIIMNNSSLSTKVHIKLSVASNSVSGLVKNTEVSLSFP